MKKLIVAVLTVALLLCSLTSCLPAMVGGLVSALPEDDEVDLSYVANNIAPEAVKASVRVEATFVGDHMIITSTSQGSGVVFKSTSSRYLILTNRHVVSAEGSILSACRVYDAYGSEHKATLIASDADYDLALLTIERKSGLELALAPLGRRSATVGDTLFSVGCPNGLNNLVTYGEAIAYAELEADKLDFTVLAHDAVTDEGSSGGGLFNAEGELVGINFAGGESTESNEKYSFAIPVDQVIEFLAENGVSTN